MADELDSLFGPNSNNLDISFLEASQTQAATTAAQTIAIAKQLVEEHDKSFNAHETLKASPDQQGLVYIDKTLDSIVENAVPNSQAIKDYFFKNVHALTYSGQIDIKTGAETVVKIYHIDPYTGLVFPEEEIDPYTGDIKYDPNTNEPVIATEKLAYVNQTSETSGSFPFLKYKTIYRGAIYILSCDPNDPSLDDPTKLVRITYTHDGETHEYVNGDYLIANKEIPCDVEKTFADFDWYNSQDADVVKLDDYQTITNKVLSNSCVTESIISKSNIKESSIVDSTMSDSSISKSFIEDSCVDAVRIHSSDIDTSKITDSCVDAVRIHSSDIDTSKITDSCVDAVRVHSSDIDTSNIATSKITDSCVDAVRIINSNASNLTVKSSTISCSGISDTSLYNVGISNSDMYNSDITSSSISNSSITDITGDIPVYKGTQTTAEAGDKSFVLKNYVDSYSFLVPNKPTVVPTLSGTFTKQDYTGSELSSDIKANSISCEVGTKVYWDGTVKWTSNNNYKNPDNTINGAWSSSGFTFADNITPDYTYVGESGEEFPLVLQLGTSSTPVEANSTGAGKTGTIKLYSTKTGLEVVDKNIQVATGVNESSASVKISFFRTCYYGYSKESIITSISDLENVETFTIDATYKNFGGKVIPSSGTLAAGADDQFFFIVYPDFINNFSKILATIGASSTDATESFKLVTSIDVTNSVGYTTTYKVYRSTQLNPVGEAKLTLT
jgi:hypothetical protein